MIADFRRKKYSPPSSLVIDGRTIEIVQLFKCLGSTISSNFKWELNVVNFAKRPSSGLFFKKVKIVWFDHTGHAHLLQSCNQIRALSNAIFMVLDTVFEVFYTFYTLHIYF